MKRETSSQLWTFETIVTKKVSEYDQGIPRSQTADNPVAPALNHILQLNLVTMKP